jgi:hypothetical protein
MLKVEAPLPLFVVESVAMEQVNSVLGNFEPKEHDALIMANIPKGGRLNWMFEQMGVSYAPRPLPGFEASQAAIKKWKSEVSKKPVAKRAKASPGRATPSKTVPTPLKSGPA